ncbi:MAG: hypothetical protein JNK40_11180 [Chromatiales bacterium]|nr:hypothetical protein [Chromatiales bacterium]
MKSIIGSVLAVLMANVAIAADSLTLRPGMGGVPDLGAIRCETFTRILPEGPTGFRQAVLTWAEGYIYGKSGRTIDEVLAAAPADGPNWTFDTLTDQIVSYCASNPESPLPVAVQDLWARLTPVATD